MNYFFIRHGQSVGNVNPDLYHTILDHDIDLTATGEKQAEKAAEDCILLQEKYGIRGESLHVFHSPYKRAEKTANIILKEWNHHGIFKKSTMNPLLRERIWGQLRVEVSEKRKIHQDENMDDFFNFFYKPEGGESFADVYQRCMIFDNMLKNYLPENSTVVIVAHGEFIKCYMMYLNQWSLEEFDKYKNPQNCEVLLFIQDEWGDKKLKTPLRVRIKN